MEVGYKTKGGTAKADKDFASTSGVLRFEAGERHQRLFVNITDNVTWGPDVYFFVQLDTPRHFEPGSGAQPQGPGVPGRCCLNTTKVRELLERSRQPTIELALPNDQIMFNLSYSVVTAGLGRER